MPTQPSNRSTVSRTPVAGRWRAGAAGALGSVLLGCCLLLAPPGQRLALLSYDLLFLFRRHADPASLQTVVVLNMDEASRKELKQPPDQPWDRRVHARLLRALAEQRAKVVVFDVLFDEPSADQQADEELAAAIRQQGRVVLGASLISSKQEGRPPSMQLLTPAAPLNAPYGIGEWPIDKGSSPIIRRQLNNVTYTNLAWQAAQIFGAAPTERLRNRWLNFYGPGGTLPTISFHRALESNSLAKDFFAGKAVFVGKAGIITSDGQTKDRHPTPYSIWSGGFTSGVELHATAFLNLVRNEWLEQMGPVAEFLVVILCGVLFGLGLTLIVGRRPHGAWLGGAAALIGALAIAGWAFGQAQWMRIWFNWLIVCAVQVPFALAWAVLTHTRRLSREKEQLEQELALAESAARLPELLDRSPDPSASTFAQSPSPRVPSAFGHSPPPIPNHELLQRIGRGAYGEVWLARNAIGTFHAVKVVHQASFDTTDPYEREFRGIQKFTPISRNHPGLVHILHVGRSDPDGYFFYIMELGDDERSGQNITPGEYSADTLARRLEKRRRLATRETLMLGIDLAAALEYLHQLNLIHRDIKPSNIVFVNGRPKFADAGLVTHTASGDRSSTFVGTEGYLAPEGPGTFPADIYSLGKVLYEASTGCDRHDFPALPATLVAGEDRSLAKLNDIVLLACETNPRQRYQSAAALRADLEKLQRSLGRG